VGWARGPPHKRIGVRNYPTNVILCMHLTTFSCRQGSRLCVLFCWFSFSFLLLLLLLLLT
jgi:hypothetical protein